MSYVLGNRIKKLRINRDISREEIAKVLDIDVQKCIDIEIGKVDISFAMIKKAADYMGVHLSEIIGDENDRKDLTTLFKESYGGEDIEKVSESVSKVEEILKVFNLHQKLYNQMRCI
jgi:transcriptional regulator with XRE-family HTH domain